MNPLLKRFPGLPWQHRHHGLGQHRSCVDLFNHLVDGASGLADPGGQRLSDGVEPPERRQQAGVQIEQTTGEGLDQAGCDDPHPTGHDHQINGVLLQPDHQGIVQVLPAGKPAMVEQAAGHAKPLGPGDGPRRRPVDDQQHHLSPAVPIGSAGLDQSLKVAAAARGQHSHAHAAIARVRGVGSVGAEAVSHLSILPTVLADAHLLANSLDALGAQVTWGGALSVVGHQEPCLLRARFDDGVQLGWRRAADGTLELVVDLQRAALGGTGQRHLARVGRAYAAREALQQAAALPGARVQLGR